jgi:serine/threonine-protein kinase
VSGEAASGGPEPVKRRLRLPGYRIAKVLGRGAQGVVVKAQRERDGKVVAVKILSAQMAAVAEFRRRFRREAQVALELAHPNIVQGIEVGQADGLPFVVMEFIDGETLGARLARGPLAEAEALPVIRDCAEALACAHARGLVHRDIKPDNVMITREGRAKLMDLGLAKETDTGQELTMSGSVFGTPGYISPEAAVDAKDTDIRADIYSLGATFFHALVGEVPFPEKTLTKALKRALTEEPPSPRARVPAVSEGCDALIRKMLNRDRKLRVQTPAELLADLELVATGAMPSRPEGYAVRARGKAPAAPGAPSRPWWRRLWPF